MTLTGSGELSLDDINVELGNTSGTLASLGSMSDIAGFTDPDSISEFYGYSHGDDITLSWGSETVTNTGPPTWRRYRVVNHTGQSSTTLTLNFSYTVFVESYDDTIDFTLGYSINTSGGMTDVVIEDFVDTSGTANLSGNFNITSVTSSDVVRVWLEIVYPNTTGNAVVDWGVTITSGSFTSGSGTISLGTPTLWTWNHYY